MKFPRGVKILRTPAEVAPFAAVFFLLAIFLMLAGLLPVPGLPIQMQPPRADRLPGADQPTVALAADSEGRLYYTNGMVTEPELREALSNAVRLAPMPLTLVIHADQSLRYDQITHLVLLARDAGITNALLATLPRVTDPESHHDAAR